MHLVPTLKALLATDVGRIGVASASSPLLFGVFLLLGRGVEAMTSSICCNIRLWDSLLFALTQFNII